MGTVITFINEKGGIGKTSLCFHTAWELANTKKVLLIDLDGQRANLTYFCGVQKPDDLVTMFDVLQNGKPVKTAIKAVRERLDIIPATVDVSILTQNAKSSTMKSVIRSLSAEYDYIFIDVSPSPNWGQFLALAASDYAIIPMLPDITSLEADNGMVETINEITDGINVNLKVLGLLFNRNEDRTNLSKLVKATAEKMAERMHTKVFDTKIRNAVAMSESIYYHVGITEYDGKLPVSGDIKALVAEIEREVQNG